MSIQPISANLSFKGQIKQTPDGNAYEKSNIGKTAGFVAGLALAGGLMHSQVSALKTISGKKNLIEGFHINGKTLNDIADRKITRNADGKIVPPTDGVSDRTKAIVKDFKKSLAVWGAAITAITTAIGAVADSSITSVRAREADELAKSKKA